MKGSEGVEGKGRTSPISIPHKVGQNYPDLSFPLSTDMLENTGPFSA